MYDFSNIKWQNYAKRKNGKWLVMCDNIICFDIETSSGFLTKNGDVVAFSTGRKEELKKCDKVTLCYVWQCSIDDTVYMGRTLEEFKQFLDELEKVNAAHKIIYIHNFAYEFQYLLNVLEFENVFARTKRKPMKANVVGYNLEIRCSYVLTNMSLKTWSEQKNLQVKKLDGEEFNYSELRTPNTVLTDRELQYCINDVLTMYYGLIEYRNKYGRIVDIPLTQTGEVRKAVQKVMRNETSYKKHISTLIPDTVKDFQILNKVFMGGWTHANYIYTDDTIENVNSYDISSSYPTVMLLEKYPYSSFIKTEPKEKYFNNDNYSYIIEFTCENVESKLFNHFLSFSKIIGGDGVVKDNGRILSADRLHLILTNIDYEIFCDVYEYDNFHIENFYCATNRYLNNEFRKYILELYGNKTTLKGIEEKAELYAISKQYINSLFGMACTRTISDTIVFDGMNWKNEPLTEESFIDKTEKQRKNISKNVIAFSTGVWVCAYGRRNLWKAIRNMDSDVVYCDTDSVKFIGNHKKFFDKYNKEIEKKIEKVASEMGVSIDLFSPKDSKGKKHTIGIFDYEGQYKKFRTLGAKKYCYEDDNNELHITVSGVRKSAVSQINDIEEFKAGLLFDEEHSKKVTMIYTDSQPSCIWNKGQPDEYISSYQYGVHATPTTYKLDVTDEYFNLFSSFDVELFTQFEPIDTDILHQWK